MTQRLNAIVVTLITIFTFAPIVEAQSVLQVLENGRELYALSPASRDGLQISCLTGKQKHVVGFRKKGTFHSYKRLNSKLRAKIKGKNPKNKRRTLRKLRRENSLLRKVASPAQRQGLEQYQSVCRSLSVQDSARFVNQSNSYPKLAVVELAEKRTSRSGSTVLRKRATCKSGQLPGDANLDCRVNRKDLTIWMKNYGSRSGGAKVADFNNDGRTDGHDYLIWRSGTGKKTRPAPKPAPAPKPSPNPDPAPAPPAGPAPALSQQAEWEGQMLEFGNRHCNELKNGSNFDVKLLTTYYDAQWVYYQIADYTGDTKWMSCAQAAEKVYRDQYVIANNGGVPGYWNFSHGVLQDYLRTGDGNSRNALQMLATKAAYAGDSTPLSSTQHADYSREVAYSMMAYMNAEFAGFPRRSRLNELRDQALDHLDQWFGKKNAPYVRPFMVALTAQALITYDKHIGDPRILPALENAMNELWKNTWIPQQESFQYTDRNHSSGGTEPAPDLNLLIAPVYGWLYHKTGKAHHRDRGDQIFAGGVKQAYLVNGKQFNQNYRWSFEYLKWRRG